MLRVYNVNSIKALLKLAKPITFFHEMSEMTWPRAIQLYTNPGHVAPMPERGLLIIQRLINA